MKMSKLLLIPLVVIVAVCMVQWLIIEMESTWTDCSDEDVPIVNGKVTGS